MDFLNRVAAQVAELFKSLSPGARVVTGLLFVLAVVSLGYLFLQQASGGGPEYLMGGASFSADELPEMEAALGKAGLKYEMDGARIRVPHARQNEYMAALAKDNALPRNFGDYLERAATSDPFANRHSQALRERHAIQQELGKMLREIEGVQAANVLFDDKKKTGLGPKIAATAAVKVTMKGNQRLTEETAATIQRLVAAAQSGLASDQVVVVDQTGQSFGGNGGAASGFDNVYLRAKRQYDQEYADKAREALKIPGATVVADVELNPEISSNEHDVKADPKAVPVRNIETTQESKTETAGPAGRPGLQAQASNQGAKVEPPSKGSSSSTKGPNTTETEYVVSHVQRTSQTAGLTPKDVRLIVGVPSSYIESIWREKNKKPDGSPPDNPPDPTALKQLETATTDELRDRLRLLVPANSAGNDPTPKVIVSVFPDIPVKEAEEEGMASKAMAWLGSNWATAGMMALAAISLAMLRSMVKAGAPAPSAAVAFDFPAASAAAPTSPAAPGEPRAPPPVRTVRRKKEGMTLRDELIEMVREDPATAAGILRAWIGNQS